MKELSYTCEAIVDDWLAGRLESEELKVDRQECAVFRVQVSDNSIVLKLWKRPGWRGLARRLSRTSPMQRENLALQRLSHARLAVPSPLGFCRIRRRSTPWTEALILQDLGNCTEAIEYTKMLAKSGQEASLERFLDDVLDLTEGMIRCGIIDTDHSFNNLVVTPSGRAARLDFEIAQTSLLNQLGYNAYGLMLARLIGSYAFSIQPEVERAYNFAQKLRTRLNPPMKVLKQVSREVGAMMDKQRLTVGIDTRVPLPWDNA